MIHDMIVKSFFPMNSGFKQAQGEKSSHTGIRTKDPWLGSHDTQVTAYETQEQ